MLSHPATILPPSQKRQLHQHLRIATFLWGALQLQAQSLTLFLFLRFSLPLDLPKVHIHVVFDPPSPLYHFSSFEITLSHLLTHNDLPLASNSMLLLLGLCEACLGNFLLAWFQLPRALTAAGPCQGPQPCSDGISNLVQEAGHGKGRGWPHELLGCCLPDFKPRAVTHTWNLGYLSLSQGFLSLSQTQHTDTNTNTEKEIIVAQFLEN